jgi:hypothetical protein
MGGVKPEKCEGINDWKQIDGTLSILEVIRIIIIWQALVFVNGAI